MSHYSAPIQEYLFLMSCFKYDHPSYDLETSKSILSQVDAITRDIILDSNGIGDQQHPIYNTQDHSVTMPSEFVTIYKTLQEQGISSLAHNEKYGGGNAPQTLMGLLSEILLSGNSALAMCQGLTSSAILCLEDSADESIKSQYLEPLISGRYSGTMCLTEPQCGTDLGLIKTKAKAYDNHFQLTGSKIWITFGEHNLSENIVHLVLARLPDAPEGIKGISLFLVPKFLADGTRNSIHCGGLEDKMGIHGAPTCVMNLEHAHGWLIGEPNKGMRSMFVMMNDARIYVGIQGLALAEIAYQTALTFCKQRRQSRSLNKKRQQLDESADIILVHPDVRRMLLACKSTNEAMRALIFMTQQKMDQKDHEMVSLLTPVIKAFTTSRSFDNISTALQSMGGCGYVKDCYIEQYFRDARISMIYEGTNGIQALDLIGRKLPRDNGKQYKRLIDMMNQDKEHFPKAYQEALDSSIEKLNDATTWLMKHAITDPESGASVAHDYLQIMAWTLLCYSWGKMVSHAGIDSEKDKTGLYFIEHELPTIDLHLTRLKKGSQYLMQHDDSEW